MTPITLAQFFHWYYPADGSLWNQLKEKAPELAKRGINAVWLPPATKGAAGGYSVGYDAYDLFDLGEFDQKGSVRTKYGTKDEYLAAVHACHEQGIKVIADAVFNHKAGGDELERIPVRKVNPLNRKEFISEPFEIEAWTKFTFPGRGNKYSSFIWDHSCFSGTDYAHDIQENGIFSIQNEYGEGWEEVTEDELGNYDYLMNADIEFRNPHVREELKHWGRWYLETTQIGGFRLDAVKHMSPNMIKEWVTYVQEISGEHLFIVGEYWKLYDPQVMVNYINATEGNIQLFDAPLHQNFYVASRSGKEFDLRRIFDNTLLKIIPDKAVTIVGNHDTQPLQELESPIEPWFKPLAYALILLRREGTPCVFYPALYGAHYKDQGSDGQEHEVWIEPVQELNALLFTRKTGMEGDQHDYLDHPNCIGWSSSGTAENAASGFAVILSNSSDGWKYMELGTHKAGRKMVDLLGNIQDPIVLNEKGGAEFRCMPGSVSLWVTEELAQNFSQQ